MSQERKKILEMLAEGKIAAEDAERLLDKLASSEPGPGDADQTASGEPVEAITQRAPLKFLRVIVDSAEGDKVNVRVPITLVRTGINLATMVPAAASDRLADSGIDLSHLSTLSGDELTEALRELAVDVDSSNGDTVRVFCE